MSDSLLDALDEVSDSDDQEESDTDAQDVNKALGDNESYWKSRNQAKKVQKTLQDDDSDDEDAMNREE